MKVYSVASVIDDEVKEMFIEALNYDETISEYKKYFEAKKIFIKRFHHKDLKERELMKAEKTISENNKLSFYKLRFKKTRTYKDQKPTHRYIDYYVEAKGYEDAVSNFVVRKMKSPKYKKISVYNMDLRQVKMSKKKYKKNKRYIID